MTPEFAIATSTLKIVVTLIILAAALYGFIREKYPPDVTALLALLITGVLTPSEAFAGFSHPATVSVARGLAGLQGVTGPFVMVLGFFVVALVVSELMSNSGTVALLAPVAVSSAAQMGINPMALLAAVTFGSSAAFSIPIGYQTSLMIYGPGGYRYRDYVRMGIPLDLLLAALALWLIPKFWPLTSP